VLKKRRTHEVSEDKRNDESNAEVNHNLASLLALGFGDRADGGNCVEATAEAQGAEGNGPGNARVHANSWSRLEGGMHMKTEETYRSRTSLQSGGLHHRAR